ncbi:HxlR family transcriptional regulator [Actinomadura pelletieri DSM 43383]|uniref:HxlR family transcriptional regulator n=1 Tax=Actinomadura pelletieri DSM 43383 TaxID=1120940 RepID=A0A495QN85_9ACTN|nr:helix-turn-helix domain-containing protein [Actinomadura pelletieri]RKS74435.1 HxlR family transcriptional regulator [Actinomadura pelletieri DSM 43383]
MSAVMEGPLADLGSWKTDHCSLVKALEIVGTRSSLLILREAYYGTTRFTGFARRVGITERIAARQLRHLTEAGLLARRPYRDEGGRTRDEYVLTEMGRDLLPVVLALMQWGDKYLQGGEAPLLYVEHDTGAPVRVELRSDTGNEVGLENLGVRRNPRWRRPQPAADGSRAEKDPSE